VETFTAPTITTTESAPCTEWQLNVGVTTDVSYTDCSGTLVTLTGLTSTATTICVKSTTTPSFTITATTNTLTNTTTPCSTPPTVTSTPPETTEKPIEDQFPEVGFYFHNDFPDPNDNRITASNDYNFWLTKYKELKTKYLTTGGSDGTRNFGKARNKIIKYDDASYYDYTNFIFSGSNQLQTKYLDNYVDTRIVKVDEFFTFINSEFEEAKRFIKKISEALDAGETVSFDLLGSASSITDEAYNINLSKRRIDSVMQWILKQVTPNQKKLVDFTTGANKKLIITTKATGEGGPLIEETYSAINCNKNYKSNSNEGTVSVNAMACRRARIIKTFISNNNTKTPTTTVTTETSPTNNDGTTSAIDPGPQNNTSGVETKPVNTVTETPAFVNQAQTGKTETNIDPPSSSLTKPPAGKVAPKRRADLTKRLARKLLTECNYFEMVKRENPMIYDGIKSKIKHFHPVFHSITPEGLNARLTFLQQCMRPGDTIPTVSMDGNNTKLIYNDVTNSVFGSPPICVLRIGDFFHTKIAIDSLSIGYEDGRFDLNPEGIGVQPMIADVKIGFNFIGGHGLAGPIASLQNALSFNYYANTEMYDERAESTFDDVASNLLQKYDAEIFEDIKNQVGVIESDDNRSNTTDGGVPIGVPVTTYLDSNNLNLVSGTISYTDIMKKLIDSTKASLKTTIDTLEKINSELLIGGLQIFTKDRKYIDGYIGVGTTDNVKIFGKSYNTQEKVENLVKLANEDVDNNICPLLDGLELEDLANPQKRKIKKYIQTLIDNKSALCVGEFNN
jgi:outer membrane protein OmpA-like peptidoglycan-associated protein